MEEEKVFYIKYPKKEFIVILVITLFQFIIPVLVPHNVLVIVWVNISVVFFGYFLLVFLLTNIFKHPCFRFTNKGIIIVNPFNKRKEYVWSDYKGYMLIENIIFLQFGNKNIKINNGNLRNGNINEIIKIIEENKVEIEYKQK
jgi:hypothetical protein